MDNTIQVVDRVFEILEYLSISDTPRGPTEVAKATGMHKSTVYRLLSAMCKNGYVEKTDAGTYYIGIKLVDIISHHINSLELQTEARPFLNDLRAELGLIVHLGVLNGDEVVYIEKMDMSANLRIYNQIGLRVPAYCSSLGKCLLSCLSGDELDYLFSRQKLKKYTPNTITSLKELKNHLRGIRVIGYSMDNEEYVTGIKCIAAPIFDYRGEMIAAVSASGPIAQMTEERTQAVIEAVKQCAKSISRRLCFGE